MRRISTVVLLSLVLTGGAMAQSSGTGATVPAPAPDKGGVTSAPVGHRQPRADQVPSEKNLSNDVSKEDAILDKKIKSICRGC